MRHRLFREICRELVTTTKWERVVLFIPFVVLIIDADIFYYAWTHHKITLIFLSSIVLILSSVEIVAVIKEIHEHISYAQKYSTIEEQVLDTVKKFPEKPTVGQVMAALSNNGKEEFSRFEVYPVVCKVLNSLYSDDGDDG
jgi:hypothetical protein